MTATNTTANTANTTDGRRARGDASRRRILRHAAELASVDGLDGVSLAHLAGDLNLSKSGVQALFGSRDELRLAIIASAVDRFTSVVVTPALAHAPGLPRLAALVDHWTDHVRRREFPGGCFFTHCLAESATRPGPVRDALIAAKQAWVLLIERQLRAARADLPPGVNPRQLAFEIDALLVAGNNGALLGDESALDRTAEGIAARLRR